MSDAGKAMWLDRFAGHTAGRGLEGHPCHPGLGRRLSGGDDFTAFLGTEKERTAAVLKEVGLIQAPCPIPVPERT